MGGGVTLKLDKLCLILTKIAGEKGRGCPNYDYRFMKNPWEIILNVYFDFILGTWLSIIRSIVSSA